jgi:hypothetical protein
MTKSTNVNRWPVFDEWWRFVGKAHGGGWAHGLPATNNAPLRAGKLHV